MNFPWLEVICVLALVAFGIGYYFYTNRSWVGTITKFYRQSDSMVKFCVTMDNGKEYLAAVDVEEGYSLRLQDRIAFKPSWKPVVIDHSIRHLKRYGTVENQTIFYGLSYWEIRTN